MTKQPPPPEPLVSMNRRGRAGLGVVDGRIGGTVLIDGFTPDPERTYTIECKYDGRKYRWAELRPTADGDTAIFDLEWKALDDYVSNAEELAVCQRYFTSGAVPETTMFPYPEQTPNSAETGPSVRFRR